MRTYSVTVTEMLSETVEVKAATEDAAKRIALEMHYGGEIECTEVADVVAEVSNKDSEYKLKKIRDKHIKGRKFFDSAYAVNDMDLPYVFDLLYDIKTEASLLEYMHGDGIEIHSEEEVISTALEYGYSFEYLEGRFSKEGRVKAYINHDGIFEDETKPICIEIYQDHGDNSDFEYFESTGQAQERMMNINDMAIWKMEDLV